jgi:hypothetical protein
MSWFPDILSTDGGDGVSETANPTERILQLRRGVSAAASALPEEHDGLARSAREAADAVGDRVAALAELRDRRALIREEEGSGDDARDRMEGESGASRRREAGGPVRAAVTDDSRLPDDLATEIRRRLDRLHFELLQVELNGEDPGSLHLEEDVEALRGLADRMPDPEAASEAGGSGTGSGDAGAG